VRPHAVDVIVVDAGHTRKLGDGGDCIGVIHSQGYPVKEGVVGPPQPVPDALGGELRDECCSLLVHDVSAAPRAAGLDSNCTMMLLRVKALSRAPSGGLRQLPGLGEPVHPRSQEATPLAKANPLERSSVRCLSVLQRKICRAGVAVGLAVLQRPARSSLVLAAVPLALAPHSALSRPSPLHVGDGKKAAAPEFLLLTGPLSSRLRGDGQGTAVLRKPAGS